MIRVRRSWVLRLASALIGTTLLLTALELTWRVLPVGEPVPRVLPTHNDPIARFHPNEKWIFSLGWDFFIVNEQRTNSAGWISHIEYSREGDAPLLAVVGDSFVQGDYVPWPDTCHGQLAINWTGGRGSIPSVITLLRLVSTSVTRNTSVTRTDPMRSRSRS